MESIFRTINQFRPTYDPFAAGASAVNIAFGGTPIGGGMGIEERFAQAQEEDARRRMETMLRMRGGGFGSSTGFRSSMGTSQNMGTPWYRTMPSLSFPSYGGMM